MKKASAFLFYMLVVFALLFVGCGTTSTVSTNNTATGMDLDIAIQEAATQMEAKIPSGTMVALVNMASPSTAFSTQVLTRLESVIVTSGKLVVVDRANLDKVRAEQGFQLSGEVDDESAKSIGKLLGAGAIVTGTLTDLGDVYNLTLKAINMETATVVVSYLSDLAKTARIETLLASGGGAGGMGVTSGRQAAAKPAEPASPAYKVGDTGPAGGIIFYDKGNNSGGWRYLEAASHDLEKARWGAVEDETKTAIGSGKQNTPLMRGRSAMLCLQYDGGGQRDWYLPSKDELDLLFMNLYIKGLGNFSESTYWSSSGKPSGLTFFIWFQDFKDGEQYHRYEDRQEYLVRPIRQF